jgi:undecaprenyl-diphosphatase
VNFFDAGIISFLNEFARRSWNFDNFVCLVALSYLFKGAGPACLFWWAWFRKDEDSTRNRELLISGLLAAFLALLVARGLAVALPFRERPIQNQALHFQLPYGTSEKTLIGWSSFPSDHAAVYFALATAIFFTWRAGGIVALCHAFFIVSLPRIYLGYHYPTDILVGALLGIGAASLLCATTLRTVAARPAVRWMDKSPGFSYALLFFVTFQVSISFDSVREIGHFCLSILKASAIASR